MRFRKRKPSFKKKLAARTSWKRYARHNLGLKAPKGWGWLTDPQKAAYNRAYNRKSFNIFTLFFLTKKLLKKNKLNNKDSVMTRKISKINQRDKLERMLRNGQINQLEYEEYKNELYDTGQKNPKKSGCLSILIKIILAGFAFLVLIIVVGMSADKSPKKDKQDDGTIADTYLYDTGEIIDSNASRSDPIRQDRVSSLSPTEKIHAPRDSLSDKKTKQDKPTLKHNPKEDSIDHLF